MAVGSLFFCLFVFAGCGGVATRAGVLCEVAQRRIRHRQERLKAAGILLLLLLRLLVRVRLRCREYWLRDHVLVQMVSRPYQQVACHDARNQQTPDTARFFLRARFRAQRSSGKPCRDRAGKFCPMAVMHTVRRAKRSPGKFCRCGKFFPADLAVRRVRAMQRSPQFIEHFKQMSVDLIDNRLIQSPERWSSRC